MSGRVPGSQGEGRESAQEYSSGGTFRTPLLVQRFPREVPVPALSPIGRTDLPVVTVFRLRGLSTAHAMAAVRTERAHVEVELASVRAEGDPRILLLKQESEAIADLERELISRTTRLWEGLLGFVVSGKSRRNLMERVLALRDDLTWQGFRFHSTKYRVGPLLSTLTPESPFPPSLAHPLTDQGVAALLPLWEDRLEERDGVLLGLHASQGTPLFWQRFSHQSHSSAIFGETGSGKTYASAIGWMRLRYRNPSLSLFVLDPLGGLVNIVRALGGETYRAGTEEVTINPLDPETTGGDLRAKTLTVLALFRALFPSITDEELAVIDSTLSSLYAGRPSKDPPLLSDLYAALEEDERAPPRLLLLLKPVLTGSLRHLNYPTELNLSGRMMGFDLSGLAPSEMPFYLALILDYVYGEIRHRPGPKLLVIDEAHYLAKTPGVAGFLDHMVRHVRHFGGGLELISQNPEDFLGTEQSRSILLNLDSVLLLRLKDGGAPVAPLLGLTPGEVEWLKETTLPGTAGYSEGLFRTGGLHFPVALVSTDEEHRVLTEAFQREMRTRHSGGATREWEPEFREISPEADEGTGHRSGTSFGGPSPPTPPVVRK